MSLAKKNDPRAKDGRTIGAKKAKVTKEEKRLQGIYAKLHKDVRAVADGLIRRAAYMRVTLEDYEEDIDKYGSVEMFQQTEKAPAYERLRPVAQNYNTLNKNYQSIVKQLADLLPKEDPLINPEADDGFDDFVNKRN